MCQIMDTWYYLYNWFPVFNPNSLLFWTFIWQRSVVYIHVQPACWYLGDRDHLLALWCIYSLYLPSLSIRDIIHVLMISLPIWDTINVLQNAVFPYHCIAHFVSLQHKQIVQFFKYTTVERMNITRLTSTKFYFYTFLSCKLKSMRRKYL